MREQLADARASAQDSSKTTADALGLAQGAVQQMQEANALAKGAQAAAQAANDQTLRLAQGALAATRESNRISSAALRRDRAWMTFSGIEPAGVEGPLVLGSNPVVLRVKYRNTGRSPAVQVRFVGATVTGTRPLGPKLTLPAPDRPGETTVGVEGEAWLALTLGPFDATQIAALAQGTLSLWLVSEVQYLDTFGARHSCRSCSVFAPDQMTWNNCDIPLHCD